MPTTGLDLKLRRVAARVRNADLAAEMGISSSRVSRIESTQFPSEDMQRRYLEALAALTDVPHVPEQVSA